MEKSYINAAAFPVLPVSTIGLWVASVSSIRLSSLELACVVVNVIINVPPVRNLGFYERSA